MESLIFNDGLKRLAINNDESRVITVNPTDFNIIKRYNAIMPQLSELTDAYKNVENITDDEGVKMLTEIDCKARTLIDELVGSSVSETVFGTAHCLTPVNGSTIFENFLEAYIQYMTPAVQQEIELSKKRVGKYTKQIEK